MLRSLAVRESFIRFSPLRFLDNLLASWLFLDLGGSLVALVGRLPVVDCLLWLVDFLGGRESAAKGVEQEAVLAKVANREVLAWGDTNLSRT